MKTMTILRARCIYSKLTLFHVGKDYGFSKISEFTSFSVYKPVAAEWCYATRMLDECSVLVIENKDGLLAVFEVC
jgi:hypothetical protein